MAERMTGLRLGGVAEESAHFGIALDVGHAREVEVTAIRLALGRESVLEVLMGLGVSEFHDSVPLAG